MVSCSNVVRSLVICCLLGCLARIGAFSTQPRTPTAGASCTSFSFHGTLWCSASDRAASNIAGGPKEIVARRILVTGDVQGGYLRACILNEAGRFRRLVGTMSPPEEGDSAEIYVEGKRKVVDGFIRWCKKADIGLSQTMNVIEVLEEEPTGLYDAFYVKTK